MILFDWIVLAIFLSAAYLGMKRGFLNAALSLATWVAAVFLAFAFGDLAVATLLSGWPAQIEVWLANNPWAGAVFRGPAVAESVALWGARLGILVIVLVIGTTLASLVSRAVQDSVFASADSALGVLLGAARGSLIAGGLLLLCTHVAPEAWLQGSMSLPLLEPVSDALSLLLRALGGR